MRPILAAAEAAARLVAAQPLPECEHKLAQPPVAAHEAPASAPARRRVRARRAAAAAAERAARHPLRRAAIPPFLLHSCRGYCPR